MKPHALKAHFAIAASMVIFGLMAPFGKDVTNAGLTGLQLATIRITGGALLFWLVSPFVRKEQVDRRDLPRLALAGLLGGVVAQASLVVGISLTSPINAGVEVSMQPIYTMLLAALLIGEAITWKKALGVALGCAGAVILVMMGTAGDSRSGNYIGDIIILAGQTCFALYLTLFTKLIRKYSIFTFNRWLFTFAALMILPFTVAETASLDTSLLSARVVAEVAYIIVGCTFVCFLLVVYAQRHLRPTVVSSYNYLQPVVTVVASLLLGVATLSVWQVVAMALIFTGVWLVITSAPARHETTVSTRHTTDNPDTSTCNHG